MNAMAEGKIPHIVMCRIRACMQILKYLCLVWLSTMCTYVWKYVYEGLNGMDAYAVC